MCSVRSYAISSPLLVFMITFLLTACNPTGRGDGARQILPPVAGGQALLPSKPDSTYIKPTANSPRPPSPLDLELCYSSVSNPPDAIGLKVTRTSALACRDGIELMVAPVARGCMTSGYGNRKRNNGAVKFHKGLDYQGPGRTASPVLSAGDGIVIINEFRKKDLGNWIIIDHGNNVFTGYGHLASKPPFDVGARVTRGQKLAMMGSTGLAAGGRIHLHVEYRTGEIGNAAHGRFFTLEHFNPFGGPADCPPA